METPSPTIDALRNLRASGDRSFEELMARLLSKASGERIRRCKAGAQGGVDAIADIPFAIEDKRYVKDVSSRELLGGLTSAARTHPDLQLWVLAATCEVGAQTFRELNDIASGLGIAVLVLDTAASDPDLPGISALTALAATDIESAVDVFSDPTWRDRGNPPDVVEIRNELTAVGSLSGFSRWHDRLQEELRKPTWRRLVRCQNQRLYSVLAGGDAKLTFDTDFNPEKAVPRSAEEELTAWQSRGDSDIAVVTGDHCNGKTWLVYRWLYEKLGELALPVFFFSSNQVKEERGDLETLVIQAAEEALGRFSRHAKAIVTRHRSSKAGTGPWCVVILDGANEYVLAPHALRKAILWAVPTMIRQFKDKVEKRDENSDDDSQPRPCGLLVTCRAYDFDEDSSWLGNRVVNRIELGPYDEKEFRAALALRSLTPKTLEHLPPLAHAMIRHPRYMDLMIRHQSDLGQFPGVTADVLHYLDALDKGGRPDILARLAATWTRDRRLDRSTVREHLHAVTDDVEQSLHALTSEGVLTRSKDGAFVPDPERLALGMGLFIRESLLSVTDQCQLSQTLSDILEPRRDDDGRLRWLRAGVTASLLAGDAEDHPKVVQTLLAAWLSSRNFAEHDLSNLRNLSPWVVTPMTQLLSSAIPLSSNVFLLAEALFLGEIQRDERVVAASIRRWFRLVPRRLHWTLHDDDVQPPNVAERVEDPSFSDLELELAEEGAEKSINRCHRLGLFLSCIRPSLVRSVDVLALLASFDAVNDHLDSGERFALRRIVADTERSWYEEEVRSWKAKPDTSRTRLLRDLIYFSDRKDLSDLRNSLPAWDYSWGVDALQRSELAELHATDNTAEILKVARRAKYLALDPTSPSPPQAWRKALGRAAINHFRNSFKPLSSRSMSRDDYDLQETEPALAAWAPDAGAQIWRSFIADIPRAAMEDEDNWAWSIDGQAALLTRSDCRALHDIALRTPAQNSQKDHALRVAYLCVLAESSSKERARLLLEHPFGLDWTHFYEILGASANDALRRRAFTAVRRERDPIRLKRARNLLAYVGGAKLSIEDLAPLIYSLSHNDPSGDSDAADFLLRYSRVDDSTPADALGPLVHLARSHVEAARQYVAFLDRKRRPGRRGAEWLARALSAPLTARSQEVDPGVSDDAAVAEGIEHLATQIRDSLRRSLENPTYIGRDWEQFPAQFAEEISSAVFDEWVTLLLSAAAHARRVHLGLLVPVLRRALRMRHPAAKTLWRLVYPFQRARFSSGSRLVVKGGIDWTLKEIHDPALDDELATELLRELIADCRSDSELVSVALGARLESVTRLTDVVHEGLGSPNDVDRARARFLGGWMPEDSELRRRLALQIAHDGSNELESAASGAAIASDGRDIGWNAFLRSAIAPAAGQPDACSSNAVTRLRRCGLKK